MKKQRYFELLLKEKALRAKNLSLDKINKSEDDELKLYKIVLEKQVFYQNRSQYIDLIQKCIDSEINCGQVQWDFLDIYYEHLEISDQKNQMSTVSIILFLVL